MCDIVLGAHFFKPFRAAAARRNDGILCAYLDLAVTVVHIDSEASVAVEDYVAALISEHYLDSCGDKVFLDRKIEIVRLLGAYMADRAINKLEPRLDCTFANILYGLGILQTLDVLVGSEFKIYPVGISYGILNLFRTDESRKFSSDLIAQRKLSVGKRARAGKSGGDMAVGLAVHAVTRLRFRTAALLDALPLLDDNDFLF